MQLVDYWEFWWIDILSLIVKIFNKLLSVRIIRIFGVDNVCLWWHYYQWLTWIFKLCIIGCIIPVLNNFIIQYWKSRFSSFSDIRILSRPHSLPVFTIARLPSILYDLRVPRNNPAPWSSHRPTTTCLYNELGWIDILLKLITRAIMFKLRYTLISLNLVITSGLLLLILNSMCLLSLMWDSFIFVLHIEVLLSESLLQLCFFLEMLF